MSIITFESILYTELCSGGRIKSLGGKDNGILYLILTLFGLAIVAHPLMQDEVNKIGK